MAFGKQAHPPAPNEATVNIHIGRFIQGFGIFQPLGQWYLRSILVWGEVKAVQKRHYDLERKKMLNWKVLKSMVDGDMLQALQETVINEIKGGAERLLGRSTSGHLPIQVDCRKCWPQGRT